MGIYREKEGAEFGTVAASQHWDIDRQIRELNKIYHGKVKFCRWAYGSDIAISIKWTAEDIDDLELPECEYIKAESLFDYEYEGSVNTVRLPKCLAVAQLDRIGEGISYDMADEMDSAYAHYNYRSLKVVIRPDTKCEIRDGFTIVKKMEDGSEQKETVIISTRDERA